MNQRGSFGGGGAAFEVESERCRLARTDFLGAMVVVIWSRSTKISRKMREEAEGVAKKNVGGRKRSAAPGYLNAQNICRFAATKVSSQRQRVFAWQRRYPKVGKGLRSDEGFTATVDQKVIPQNICVCYAAT